MRYFGHRRQATRGRSSRTRLNLLALLATLVALGVVFSFPGGAVSTGEPTIQSDYADYNPGQTVTLTGANWDAGGTSVHIVVNDTVGNTWSHTADVTPAADGTIKDVFQLPTTFIAQYSVNATQTTATGTLTASSSFTDANPSADIDQCANDPAPSPNTDGCDSSASQWVNGNLGSSKSLYFEGDSIPYRLRFDNLTLASHTVTIEWDTTKSGTHAIDYLTTFNRTVADADPCLGVSSCGSASTFPIPADPQVTGGGVTPIPGNFTMYGGTITAVGSYSYPDGSGFSGDKSARITLTFTASQANPVLAWAGHISTRSDWGLTNSAVAISGSPYHTRLIDLDGAGGNQDRSLSADAVIFPGSITIVKDATPNGATSFGFTASPSPLTNFSLVDDGTTANTQVFGNITTFQTYTVTESSVTNWSLTGIVCSVTSPNGGSQATSGSTATIDLKEGENVTCTYSNVLQTGTLIVKKHVINDDGGSATASSWSLHVKSGTTDVSGSPQNGSESGTSYTLPAGSYAVSETGGPTGYTQTGISGDCDSSGNVTVVVGQTKTCTITNDDNKPQLKLVKTVTNDDGGTATAADFTLSATAASPNDGRNFTSKTASPVFHDVFANTSYVLDESGPSGYTAGTWSCDGGTFDSATHSISVPLGGSVTCTINNNDNKPQLKLVKTVTNNDGGASGPGDFTLSATAASPNDGRNFTSKTASPVFHDVFANTSYVLDESGPSGYTAGTWSCDGGTFDSATHSISVPLGGSVTCTINNNDNKPQLKLVKHVTNSNGGTATAADFTLSATAASPNDGRNFTSKTASPVFHDVFANASYVLDESGPSGYTAGTWSCDGGTFDATTHSVTLALGSQVTCEITNTDNTTQLKLVKTVTNNDGGASGPGDFTLSATAASPNDGRNFTSKTASPVFHGVFANASYVLDESGPSGYTAGTWSCDGGTFDSATHSVTLALGASVTCTINNNDNKPQLKLVKTVTNDDGGTATAADFTLSATAASPNDGRNFTSKTASPVFHDVFANASYVLDESGPSGYTAGTWSCDGGTFDSATHSVTLALGASVTCTINNNDNKPQLKLVKTVTTDDGGTATAADFTLSATAASPNDGRNFTSKTASPVFHDVFANASYVLDESGPSGYTAGTWSCDGGTFDSATHSISVPLGGSVTCTINNNDNKPQLKLVKQVVNDNGGTATAADFTLSATAASPNNGRNFTSKTASPIFHDVFANASYVLDESGPSAYTAGSWSCDGGTFDAATHSVTLALGTQVTCEITNDDKPGTIVIVKSAKPASGTFDFTTTGTSTNAPDSAAWAAGFSLTGSTSGGTNQKSFQLDAGTYTAQEGTQGNWILTGIGGSISDPLACTVAGSGGSDGSGDLNTQTVTIHLNIGDTVTCVFENTGTLVTRTQGFWATHSGLANIAWFGGTYAGHTFDGVAAVTGIGDTTLCGRPIDTLGKLMGGFWSNISKKSDGSKRSKLDQARMQLLQQILAAELNAAAFGATPSSGSFSAWESAYCGTNQNAIQTALQQAASFNTAGDSGTFTPGVSADAKNARTIADLGFWDTLP